MRKRQGTSWRTYSVGQRRHWLFHGAAGASDEWAFEPSLAQEARKPPAAGTSRRAGATRGFDRVAAERSRYCPFSSGMRGTPAGAAGRLLRRRAASVDHSDSAGTSRPSPGLPRRSGSASSRLAELTSRSARRSPDRVGGICSVREYSWSMGKACSGILQVEDQVFDFSEDGPGLRARHAAR